MSSCIWKILVLQYLLQWFWDFLFVTIAHKINKCLSQNQKKDSGSIPRNVFVACET